MTDVDAFIDKLNCLDDIKISRLGKIDLGVHNRFELEQEEYCFDIAYDDEGASLLIDNKRLIGNFNLEIYEWNELSVKII